MLQVLMLLKQTRQGAMADSRLEFRGPLVDLGGFGACISDHDTSRPLDVELDVSGATRNRNLDFEPNRRYTMRYEWDEETRTPYLSRIALSNHRGRDRLLFSTKGDGRDLYLANESSSRNLMEKWISSNAERASADARDVSWVRGWLRKTPVALFGWTPIWSPRELGFGRPGRPVGGSLSSSKRQLLQRVLFDWQNWAYDVAFDLDRMLEEVSYVGPLRDAPRRIHVEGGSLREGMGTRGERAARLLARDPELLWRLNSALEMLEIPYEVMSEEIGTSAAVVSAIGEISALVLKDRRSGLTVTPSDVGFGISQILPVVLQLLLSKNSIICIEQPEVHLHPRLQSRLGDIIIASSTLRGNQVVIETHSEHLLLRIQRRIRAGSMSSDDLGVLYVELGGTGIPTVTPIEIDERGQLKTAWPNGFFDERLEDLLADDEAPFTVDPRLGG